MIHMKCANVSFMQMLDDVVHLLHTHPRAHTFAIDASALHTDGDIKYADVEVVRVVRLYCTYQFMQTYLKNKFVVLSTQYDEHPRRWLTIDCRNWVFWFFVLCFF